MFPYYIQSCKESTPVVSEDMYVYLVPGTTIQKTI